MKRLALSGRIGSGKSTVAEILREEGYLDIAIADCLKRMISSIYNVNIDYFHNQELKNIRLSSLGGMTPREVMTFLGTDCFHKIKATTWIDKTISDISDILELDLPVVITDVRFPHEWLALKELGFKLIYINRSIEDEFDFLNEVLIFLGIRKIHKSERYGAYLKGQSSYIINNVGNISDLKNQVMSLIND
ncbi:hypothetical protein H6G33_10550 [Calothrix sp. FACHB-1219]|uniref:deoxynucleotide monophosphate kinase family protein n=1 Tax=unclassified Calothrix TaxID=2619626 RepID=UPI00168A356F|nr:MULTISPECIES: hypothetical protein [unclassified Calothrix]MBD2201787.1 hypothetical protein [Calothrix sp. FACHB-168]MBD2217473.1 hypothetical protein [Calothrix sp. FACHB-1219]